MNRAVLLLFFLILAVIAIPGAFGVFNARSAAAQTGLIKAKSLPSPLMGFRTDGANISVDVSPSSSPEISVSQNVGGDDFVITNHRGDYVIVDGSATIVPRTPDKENYQLLVGTDPKDAKKLCWEYAGTELHKVNPPNQTNPMARATQVLVGDKKLSAVQVLVSRRHRIETSCS